MSLILSFSVQYSSSPMDLSPNLPEYIYSYSNMAYKVSLLRNFFFQSFNNFSYIVSKTQNFIDLVDIVDSH